MPLAWDRAETDNSWAKVFVALVWPIIPVATLLYWLIIRKDLTSPD